MDGDIVHVFLHKYWDALRRTGSLEVHWIENVYTGTYNIAGFFDVWNGMTVIPMPLFLFIIWSKCWHSAQKKDS